MRNDFGTRSNVRFPYAKRAKKSTGGNSQGYDARLDESLGARHPGATGSLAGRRAMSEGASRAAGQGAFSGAGTMVKRGGSIKKAKGGRVKAMHGGMKAKKKK